MSKDFRVRMLPLTTPKGSSESEFIVFVNKVQLKSNKVCYKVLCVKTLNQQSCSKTIFFI